VADLTM